MADTENSVEKAEVGLDRDIFLRSLLRELAGTLEAVVGLDDASGYISVVGGAIGSQINQAYKKEINVQNLSREEIGEVLVDLKRRIEGDFYIIEADDTKIVLGNNACPFGEYVEGRPSLCMMTSNVFGTIAADNLGYANVVIEKAIARGDKGCRVVVNLVQPDEAPEGREYFGG
ncbi:transcriptional regulator [Henriciella barbarensis]|uniref:Transcriptional regulator n=1 Tax=Henriciella barbarensis TaxID=86342 RepID=A0A399QXM8_9PROT|nr:methanogen output domain 1-containing protein [Henriciella barbarensis]RIJ23533.1 transcriptional regulator [Henriciella barbarensis]